jgi:ElaB/YqjD/DUF883 family membrane-anchored ribosome-binding protein
MELRKDELIQAEGLVGNDVGQVLRDAGERIRETTDASYAGLIEARDKLDESFSQLKSKVIEASRPAMQRAKVSASAADAYVRSNPWTAIGAVALAAAVVGVLASRR